MRLVRVWRSVIAIAIAAGWTASAAAQSVQVSGGAVDLQSTTGQSNSVAITGDRGFSFIASPSTVAGRVDVFTSCNDDPLNCTPGRSVSLFATWSGNDLPGIATLGGVTYTHLGGSENTALIELDGSAVLPPIADTATLSVPFSFSGVFTHNNTAPGVQIDDGLPENGDTSSEMLSGSGTATLVLTRATAVGFPDSWILSEVLYEFAGALPDPWGSVDVGFVGQAGSAAFSNGTFSVAGSGADIWGSSDAFQFVYGRVPESGEVTARVVAQQDTHAFAKAGLMFRRSFDAFAGHVVLDVRPDGSIEFMTRSTSGSQTTFVAGAAAAVPVWLRLSWTPTSVTGSFSLDGASWTTVGETSTPARERLEGALAGLVVTSHDNEAINEALFDHVSIGAEALPEGWVAEDVGPVGVSGSTSYAGGVFTVSGAGADIWGTTDSFRWVWSPIASGDATVTARVQSQDATNSFAKAGVMFRESDSPDTPHVILDVRPNGSVEFMSRAFAGGQTSFIAGASVSFPVWLRLERTGASYSGFVSQDGATWSNVGTTTLDSAGAFAGGAGLAVTSHDASILNTAVFDNVSVSTSSGGPGSGNLLVSPGFEEYTPPSLGGTGWVADTARQVPAKSETNQPHTGQQNAACWSPEALDCGLYQDLTAPATGTYTLAFFANSDAGGLVGVNRNGGSLVSQPVESRGFANYGSAYTLTFDATAGDVIRIWMYKPAAPGWVVLDDVSLIAPTD